MSDLPPEKKLRLTELTMTETESIPLSANELNRFSRQNAALGNLLSCVSITASNILRVIFPFVSINRC
jgi:hypothetical protein